MSVIHSRLIRTTDTGQPLVRTYQSIHSTTRPRPIHPIATRPPRDGFVPFHGARREELLQRRVGWRRLRQSVSFRLSGRRGTLKRPPQHWDLNTGQRVRKFFSHGAQVACVAVRPYSAWVPPPPERDSGPERAALRADSGGKKTDAADEDAKSDDSYDPLFDDEPDASGAASHGGGSNAVPMQSSHASPLPSSQPASRGNGVRFPPKASATPPRGPASLDPASYATFSPDVLMTASIDGQIVLWDRRVDAPGKGVGRLEASDKTPPWCVSVRRPARSRHCVVLTSFHFAGLLVRRRRANLRRETQRDGGRVGHAAIRTGVGRNTATAEDDP